MVVDLLDQDNGRFVPLSVGLSEERVMQVKGAHVRGVVREIFALKILLFSMLGLI